MDCVPLCAGGLDSNRLPDVASARTIGPVPSGPLHSPGASLPAAGLLGRVLVLALILAAELLVVTVWVDGDDLARRPTLIRFAGVAGSWILRGVVGFAALFATFAYLSRKSTIDRLSQELAGNRVAWSFLAGHASALGVLR